MHVIAAKAVAFKEALEPAFKDYQRQVVQNAQAMAEVFISRGYEVVSGGTETTCFWWLHRLGVDRQGSGRRPRAMPTSR